MIGNAPQPTWHAERWGFSGKTERNLRDLSHVSLLVFGFTAVAAGVLASAALSSEFGIDKSSSLIVVAVLFPLLCGWLAKERYRAKRLGNRIARHEADLRPACAPLEYGDNAPAGLLIVSPDLRLCFVDRPYQHESRGTPGWTIQDIKTADGIESHARALIGSADPAASCCFDSLIRAGEAGERLIHITMTRLAPRRGADRILIVVEDLLQRFSPEAIIPVKGYIC